MARSKKRSHPSPRSLESSDSLLLEPHWKKKSKGAVVNLVDNSESDESNKDLSPTELSSTNLGSTQANTSPEDFSDQKELAKARKLHQNQLSSSYLYYNSPHLFNQLDKNGCKMIAFPCKACGTRIHRPTYDTSLTNLSKHVANCLKKQQQVIETKNLAAVGVSGTGDINPHKVAQLCAIWCAGAAHPFLALGKQAHRGILHTTVLKNLPNRKAVSRDINILYTGVQEEYIKSLEDHKGAMYLGLNAWQSPNGYDILGAVVYRLIQHKGNIFELEAMPLGFFRLKERHTGVYLAETVRAIVAKFRVQNKICGIVTDNATNNQKMIQEIAKFRWPRFTGEAQWAQKDINCHHAESNSDSNEGSDSDPEGPQDLIQMYNKDKYNSEDEDTDYHTAMDKNISGKLINDKELELETEDINDLSDKDDNDIYTTKSCQETLAKS
ncbi:hypothetical protein PTTG_26754 [Puccinia triticina 1-1 BBBD Race 1]|uniref:DUF659 domain-containing protein n=1 Tax=Puccinia triticina (isolate 1-1 / race 1 (BBBD)) TaxID=630390 RepID=A0A180GQR1_PUCT1|nr:hypothetical protein PTTG_26754 [Puccinia triticina 1-1 BBBD Race 1]